MHMSITSQLMILVYVLVLAGSWYTIDVNEVVAEALDDGSDTPRSDCYTINGQPGDLVTCSNGMF